jgi:hypothetical protein
MQARVTTKPEQEVIAAIQALDLESVKSRVMDPELGEGWTRAHADSIEAAYKNYLTILVKYQDHAEDILLSKDVDEFWHTHILQTIKYTEDCEKVFGGFLHHSPHVGERSPADLERRVELAEITRGLYEREFGSARNAETAWSGDAIKAGDAAFSTAAIRPEEAAFSTSSIHAAKAAFSTAAIQADRAAFSTASVRAENAAFSTAAIRAGNAAFSTAAIQADNAAFSTASIRAENAAFSTVAIRAGKAAFSTAAVRNAASSAAA